jgi:transcriptional regulator with XRE-family HTH domain
MTSNRGRWLRDWEARRMEDPEFRAAVEKLQPAYEVARLRIKRGLTQQELAKLVGTRQSSIARLESGRSEPRLSFLRRVARALGARVETRLVLDDPSYRPFEASVLAEMDAMFSGGSGQEELSDDLPIDRATCAETAAPRRVKVTG